MPLIPREIGGSFIDFGYYSAGGVIILGGKGKIDIDNTLEARLQLLEHAAAPAVRENLFGKNPNRKYYD